MTTQRQVVQVDVAGDDLELAIDVLWQARPSAVGEAALGDGRTRLTADVADLDALERLPAGCDVTIVEVDGDAHLDAWRAWATPVRAGRRLVLQPAWLPPAPEGNDGDVIIVLDPGRAFGSGSHATTRLVLAVIETELTPGARVLDVGTGSGVLAVASALLGASLVVATDIDPAALDATRSNAAVNEVEDRIVLTDRRPGAIEGQFDLVVANIGGAVLQSLAGELTARVRPGGLLVLSGLLADATDEVVACFEGFEEVARPGEDGWTAPVLRRAGPTDGSGHLGR